MAKNDNLHKAKDAKNDEFYTRIEDVAEELRHYKKHFAGKVVFCNCDDPTWSAFWRYFHLNFAELGLKKLISTHYDRTEPTYKMEYEGGDDNNVEVGVKAPLEGNGLAGKSRNLSTKVLPPHQMREEEFYLYSF